MRRTASGFGQAIYVHRRAIARRFFLAGIAAGIVFGVVFLITLLQVSPEAASVVCRADHTEIKIIQKYSEQTGNLVGVNLGGWLCLEDWFFSGAVGRYVSTPNQLPGQGACLPPHVPGPLKEPWGSEGQLVSMLANANYGQFQQGPKCLEAQDPLQAVQRACQQELTWLPPWMPWNCEEAGKIAPRDPSDVILDACASSDRQIFLFPDTGAVGTIQYQNKCLDVEEGKVANGTTIQLWDCMFQNGNQQFIIEKGSNLVRWSSHQQFCLTSSIVDHLMLWECEKANMTLWSGDGAQKFQIDYAVKGPERAVEAFIGHRATFINETDYEQISVLGVKSVRLPLSWQVFADVMADVAPDVYGNYDPYEDTVVVPDPYYTDLSFVTIPRKWLKERIEAMAAKGLRIVLDFHNMPGGSSSGTYSGIWPREPAFWNHNMTIGGNGSPGSSKVPLREVGLRMAKAAYDWVEKDLHKLVSSGAIWGMCMMNEPGHMAAWSTWGTGQMVLDQLGTIADMFRNTTLPGRGVRLYLQIIETAFAPGTFDEVVAPWYHSMFTKEERYSWAVLSRHHYTAWSGGWAGGKVYPGEAYTCDQALAGVRKILARDMSGFARGFADKYHGLRALTEWSLGTNPDADLACTNLDLLRVVFEENVKAWGLLGHENRIEPFFWTWRIPYGPKFQPGWSLKYFSGMAGVEPEVSNGRCVVGSWAKENPLNAQ